MRNPSLREQPRRKPAPVISTKQQVSILHWLKESNRLIAREETVGGYDYKDESAELDALVVGDNNYDDEEEDDEDDDDED